MRKLRQRMHKQSQEIQERNAEITTLKRDIGWRGDRVKILEKEIKALNLELESYKNS